MRESIQRCECGNSQYLGDEHEGHIEQYRYCNNGKCKQLAIQRAKLDNECQEEYTQVEEKVKIKHLHKRDRDFFRGTR